MLYLFHPFSDVFYVVLGGFKAKSALKSSVFGALSLFDVAQVVVKALASSGPAQAAGVRAGWAVDWSRTMRLNESTKLPPTEAQSDYYILRLFLKSIIFCYYY